MRTGFRLLVGVTAVFTMATVFAGTAGGAPPTTDVGTAVTFEIQSGSLFINGPATGNLGAAGFSGTVSAALGDVKVTDARALADAPWDATVTATNFTTGPLPAGPGATVPAADVIYASGPGGTPIGNGTFTPGQPTIALGEPLDTLAPLTAYSHTGGPGGSIVFWAPTLSLTFPVDNVAGIYTGTVTHSVA